MPTLLLSLACAWLLLQPVQFLRLPGNAQPADLAAIAWLPLQWSWLCATGAHQRMALPLLLPFAVLLAASATAAACSAQPSDGLASILSECWLYACFATFACALAVATERAQRVMLWAWVLAGISNGALVLLQFLRPDTLDAANAMLAGRGSLDPFRPSGLFENCNSAAFFQLAALAPLVALRLQPSRAWPCGAWIALSMLGTGSMGATIALAVGIAVAIVAILMVQRDEAAFVRVAVRAAVAVLLLATLGAVATALDADMAQRVDYVLTGRGEGSAQSRMSLWTHGMDILGREFLPLGIGPDRFKAIAGFGLHNDALAFAIERGMLGFFAAALFALAASRSAVLVAREGAARRDVATTVPLGALAACLALSLTHEVFHQRPLWLLLALQEGLRVRAASAAA